MNGMRLRLGSFPVNSIVSGSPSRWTEGILTVDQDRLRGVILEDPRIRGAAVDLVEPGEPTRIIHVRDIVEPRVKVDGPGHAYPGICGHPADTVGRGTTFRLGHFGVAICSEVLTHIRRNVSAAEDTLIDMSGPGAVTPYSDLRYVVLTLETDRHLELTEWNDALRCAGHRVAGELANLLLGQKPPHTRVLELPPTNGDLPGVVLVHSLNASIIPSIGCGIYGFTPHTLPTILHPNEIADGAIAGDAVVAYPGKCSWLQVNNPALKALYARHGKDISWIGTIVSRTRWGSLREKQLSAGQTVKLAELLGARGALVTWNHGGNDIIEVMLTIQGLERAGIKTVFLTIESDIKIVRMTSHLAETGTDEPPLLFSVPEADAIVSTGMLAPATVLPAMTRIVGGTEIVFDQERPDIRTPARGPLDLDALSGARSPLFGHFDTYGLGRQSYFDY